jgi:hypothetical protein
MVEGVPGGKANMRRWLQGLSGSNQARTCILFLPPALFEGFFSQRLLFIFVCFCAKPLLGFSQRSKVRMSE